MSNIEETVREIFAQPENMLMGTRDFLVNGLEYARNPTTEHTKYTFQKGGTAHCVGGFLLAGNGVPIGDGSQYNLPFTGELARFNEANDYLCKLAATANYQELNDTCWFDKTWTIALFECALEDYDADHSS